MKRTHLYTVGTWDMDLQKYTPQAGLDCPSENVPIATVRRILKQLRRMGYSAHRRRDADGDHSDNDFSVLVERTREGE